VRGGSGSRGGVDRAASAGARARAPGALQSAVAARVDTTP
jgi:hypothetical protein